MARSVLLFVVVVLAVVGVAGAQGLADITAAVKEISTSADEIKTAVLTILGVLVTVGLAYSIVQGLRK